MPRKYIDVNVSTYNSLLHIRCDQICLLKLTWSLKKHMLSSDHIVLYSKLNAVF